MAKSNLVISDKEKYGDSPMGMTSPAAPGGKKKAPPKHAPTLDLTGPQVMAFLGVENPSQGDTGCSKVNWTVKAVRAGESYGTAVTTTKSPVSVTLQLTHGVPCDADAEDEAGEGDEEEDENDDDAGPEATEDEGAEPDDSKPAAPVKETLSPSAALGEEDV